jgi:hypothetical protein
LKKQIKKKKFRFIWPCGFREDFLEIDQSETDDGQRTPNDGKSSHCIWQVELKRQVTF